MKMKWAVVSRAHQQKVLGYIDEVSEGNSGHGWPQL